MRLSGGVLRARLSHRQCGSQPISVWLRRTPVPHAEVFTQLLSIVPKKKSKVLQILSPETAYVISNILADPSARLLTFGNPSYFDFGFPVSVKTGTSTNYRDSWIVAYTPRHVVGLWAGNFKRPPDQPFCCSYRARPDTASDRGPTLWIGAA